MTCLNPDLQPIECENHKGCHECRLHLRVLDPPQGNHPQTIIQWLEERIICSIIGHARHTGFSKGKYQPKYCYRCGKHVRNWR